MTWILQMSWPYFSATISKCRKSRPVSIHKQKTKVMKVNTASTKPVLLESTCSLDTRRGRVLHLCTSAVSSMHRAVWMKNWQNQDSFPATSNYLEIERIVSTYQDQDFQLKCKFSFTLCCWDMEDNKTYCHQSTNFHQQLPLENPEGALVRQVQQYQPVGKNTADPSRMGNVKRGMEMDGHMLRKPLASTMHNIC